MLKKHDAIFILIVVLSITIPIMVGLLTVADSVREMSEKLDLNNVTEAMLGIKHNIIRLTNLFDLIDFNLLQGILMKINETIANNRSFVIKIVYDIPNRTMII